MIDVFSLSGNFIDFVNVNYTALRAFHIKIRRLKEPEQNILNVIAHITCFRKCRGSAMANGPAGISPVSAQGMFCRRRSGPPAEYSTSEALYRCFSEEYPLIVVVDGYRELSWPNPAL